MDLVWDVQGQYTQRRSLKVNQHDPNMFILAIMIRICHTTTKMKGNLLLVSLEWYTLGFPNQL
jgi:hypothetical protein